MDEDSSKPGWGLYTFGTKATEDFWAPRDAFAEDDPQSWAALDEWRRSCRRRHHRATWEDALQMAEPWAYGCIATAHYLLMRAGHATVAPRIAWGDAALAAMRERYPEVMADPADKHYMWDDDYARRLAAGESVDALNAAFANDMIVRAASSVRREVQLLREHENIREAQDAGAYAADGPGLLCQAGLNLGYLLVAARVRVEPPSDCTTEELRACGLYREGMVVGWADTGAVSGELADIARRLMGPEVLAGCAAFEARMAPR